MFPSCFVPLARLFSQLILCLRPLCKRSLSENLRKCWQALLFKSVYPQAKLGFSALKIPSPIIYKLRCLRVSYSIQARQGRKEGRKEGGSAPRFMSAQSSIQTRIKCWERERSLRRRWLLSEPKLSVSHSLTHSHTIQGVQSLRI